MTWVLLLCAAMALLASACGTTGTAASDAAAHSGRGRHTNRTHPPTRIERSATTRPTVATTTPPPATTTPPTTIPETTIPETTTPETTTPDTAPPATTPPARTGPGDHGPITSPPLPAPGPGFVENRVTAIGDSVMIDYEGVLSQDIPGVQITAAVSRQWTQGESILSQLKAQDQLGAVVIVGLGTNGPVTAAQFDSMMSVLTGASRVVFVNIHVDRTWQDANNAVLASGVGRFARDVLCDWYTVAAEHPTWLYPTQTHLPIDGTGAQALAQLVASSA